MRKNYRQNQFIARREEGETLSMHDDSFYLKPRIIVMEMCSSGRVEHTFTSCFSCFPLFGASVIARPIIIRIGIEERGTSFFQRRKRKQKLFCLVWHLSPSVAFVCGNTACICRLASSIRLNFAHRRRGSRGAETKEHISHNVAFCQ